MNIGVQGYNQHAVDQTESLSCWAAVVTNVLKTFNLQVNSSGDPLHPEAGFANYYWDKSLCPDAKERRRRPANGPLSWNFGVNDLECVLDFAAIHAKDTNFPGKLKRTSLLSALKASKIVLYLAQSKAHVVVIYAASEGRGDKLRLFIHDPALGMKGVDFSAKRHVGKQAYAVQKRTGSG